MKTRRAIWLALTSVSLLWACQATAPRVDRHANRLHLPVHPALTVAVDPQFPYLAGTDWAFHSEGTYTLQTQAHCFGRTQNGRVTDGVIVRIYKLDEGGVWITRGDGALVAWIKGQIDAGEISLGGHAYQYAVAPFRKVFTSPEAAVLRKQGLQAGPCHLVRVLSRLLGTYRGGGRIDLAYFEAVEPTRPGAGCGNWRPYGGSPGGRETFLRGFMARSLEAFRVLDDPQAVATTSWKAPPADESANASPVDPKPDRPWPAAAGSFEEPDCTASGWLLGPIDGGITGRDGHQKVYVDTGRGASGTPSALAMSFRLGADDPAAGPHRARAVMVNRAPRDLSACNQMVFSLRASRPLRMIFGLVDGEQGPGKGESWWRALSVDTDWQELRIPFESLAVHEPRARQRGTNRVLDTGRVQRLFWLVNTRYTAPGTEAIVWLDEVRCE